MIELVIEVLRIRRHVDRVCLRVLPVSAQDFQSRANRVAAAWDIGPGAHGHRPLSVAEIENLAFDCGRYRTDQCLVAFASDALAYKEAGSIDTEEHPPQATSPHRLNID